MGSENAASVTSTFPNAVKVRVNFEFAPMSFIAENWKQFQVDFVTVEVVLKPRAFWNEFRRVAILASSEGSPARAVAETPHIAKAKASLERRET
jgi:hypothetical protein